MAITWLTDRLELEVPIVCAPMAGVAGGTLAAAVSRAGALGMVGFGAGAPADLENEMRLAGEARRPFGVGLLAWVLERQPELLEAVLAEPPALVSISFGDYATHVDRIKAAGSLCATQVGTVAEAVAAVDAGVDVVVARGGEGGGHGRDAVASLPLLQAVLDAVDRPVLAAGGIASPRGLAAVLAAGAAGAWVGTAFIPCPESAASTEVKQRLVAAAETDTVYSTVFDIGRGAPWPAEFGGRALRNAFADRWLGHEDDLRASGERSAETAVWAGQGVGGIRAERPAAEVVADLARADDLLRDVAQRCR